MIKRRLKMDIFTSKAITVLVLLMARGHPQFLAVVADTHVDCMFPCHSSGNSCFTIGCMQERLHTECKIYLHNLPNLRSSGVNINNRTCVSHEQTTSLLRRFCDNLHRNESIANIKRDAIEDGTNIQNDDTESTVTAVCVGYLTMFPIAAGGFVAGCFCTWIFLVLVGNKLGCFIKKTTNACSNVQESNTDQARPVHSSASHQRLLSNTSIDSGLSSSNAMSHTPRNSSGHVQSPHVQGISTEGRPDLIPRHGTIAMNLRRVYLPANQIESIYSPASESSSRDYQSIHGGSEANYAPSSEAGSSDISGPPTHRVVFIRGDGIYQPNSDSSSNDYTSFYGRRLDIGDIYYAGSDSSNRDYDSLAGDREHLVIYNDLVMDPKSAPTKSPSISACSIGHIDRAIQRPSTRPIAALPKRRNFTPVGRSGLPNVQEVNALESTMERSVHADGAMSDDFHDYDVCSDADLNVKHEYFILEPITLHGRDG